MKRLATYITSYRKTGFDIKSDQEKKALFMKTRIRLMPIFLIAFLIVAGFGLFNIFFTLQVILKFVIAYSSALSLYYIVIIDYNTAMDWQSYSTRNESIKGKILHSIKEGAILFGISMIIIGIIYLIRLPQNLETSLLEKITGDETPLRYMPNTIETILLAGIILLTLFSIIAYIRWFYLRGIKITGYFKDKKRIKIDLKPLIYWGINQLVWCFILPILDVIFIETRYPETSSRYQFFKNIFASKPYMLLVIQLSIILLLTAFYFIDGAIVNKRRKNFVELDLIDMINNEEEFPH